ncbi:TonB family protein [Vibrio ziniensis]|uniref:Energy transducer TonB n=1 Tax=Vibrio ziniensis TaxID=2711221 RepID=A0A6G7CP52_9VIBR|nr:TonB family protein [Vibrio ziniensis]QIH43872.1 energy transducer TonB [Vibrio ziniensis]
MSDLLRETKVSVSKATLVSIGLHIVVIFAIWCEWTSVQTAAHKAPAAKISVGIRAASVGQVAQNAVNPQKKIVEVTEPVIEPKPEQPLEKKTKFVEKPKPIESKPKPVPAKLVQSTETKVVPKREDKQVEVKKPDKKVKENKAEPVIVPKPIEITPPQAKQVAQLNGSQGISGSADAKMKVQETGKSNQHVGDPNTAIFDVTLRQHLMKFKEYPRSLKLKRKEGTVEVLFTINNKGELLSSKILSRKGHRDFEKGIAGIFERAKPLPVPSSEAQWVTREYRLVFNFELN